MTINEISMHFYSIDKNYKSKIFLLKNQKLRVYPSRNIIRNLQFLKVQILIANCTYIPKHLISYLYPFSFVTNKPALAKTKKIFQEEYKKILENLPDIFEDFIKINF